MNTVLLIIGVYVLVYALMSLVFKYLVPVFIWYDDDLPDNVNARNNSFRIAMNKKCENQIAVLAQELYELKLKRNFFMLFGVSFIRRLEMQMEIMGHEIEVQAMKWAYNYTPQEAREYRKEEAYALTHYDAFKGIPEEDILEMMIKKSTEAEKWLNKNKKKVLNLFSELH